MTYARNTTKPSKDQNERCDIRVWSGDCKQSSYADTSEKYMCVSCGIISNLDHEVRGEIFPHVSGDYDNLS